MQFAAEYVGNSLISTHQPDSGPVRGAVLLCGPLFHEYYKAHAFLRQLADELATQGFWVARFDYSGLGDALGEASAVQPGEWQEDLARAAEYARQKSVCPHLDLVTVRLSTLLVSGCHLGSRLHVAIDPVQSGPGYLAELRERHRQLLERQPRPAGPFPGSHQEELLGEAWSSTLIDFIGHLRLQNPPDREFRSRFPWSGVSLERVQLPEVTRQVVEVLG